MNMTNARDEIYVAASPLRAPKGPAHLPLSAAFSLNLWPLHHFMLIIKPSPGFEGLVFDFQPQDPEDIYVALAALSGRPIPGTIKIRKISKIPKTRCWYIGLSKANMNAVEAAHDFNNCWDTDLYIGHHDCRDYTNGLAEVLTGKKNVLQDLRSGDIR